MRRHLPSFVFVSFVLVTFVVTAAAPSSSSSSDDLFSDPTIHRDDDPFHDENVDEIEISMPMTIIDDGGEYSMTSIYDDVDDVVDVDVAEDYIIGGIGDDDGALTPSNASIIPGGSHVIAIPSSSLFDDVPTSVASSSDASTMSSSHASSITATSTNMLDDKIICGYQGWFGYPGDGAPIRRWRHWFRVNGTAPTYDDVIVDMYPTIDEYDPNDVMETGINMPDGTRAKFYSSVRPNVVLKHFEWMREYGISGAVHHRFMTDSGNTPIHNTRTMVLRNVKYAAEATGRIFAVSYDIAGNGNDVLTRLKNDWISLVDNENITSSPSYIFQNGLPVLHIFGIGFTSVPLDDTTGMQNLVNWLTSSVAGKYRVFLIGGVPGKWRSGTGDSRPGDAWKGIYDSLDGIHPWHVGRWDNDETFDDYYATHIKDDVSYCKARGIRYMPTMWPGFSWHNLKSEIDPRPALNAIPRRGGNFMWTQAYKYAANDDISTIFTAQFDEVDEGTAIFKVAPRKVDLPLPIGGWLSLDADGIDVPSDWYLRLTGEAQRMLDGSRPLTSTLPLTRKPTSRPTTRMPTRMPSTSLPTTSTHAPTAKPTTSGPTTRMPTSRPSTRPPTKKPTKPT